MIKYCDDKNCGSLLGLGHYYSPCCDDHYGFKKSGNYRGMTDLQKNELVCEQCNDNFSVPPKFRKLIRLQLLK